MPLAHSLRAIWWLVVKDLLGEVRVRRAWLGMFLLGFVLLLLLEMYTDLPTGQKLQLISGLLWLDVFFAGTLSLESSFASEREEGCWRSLCLYPISPSVIFLAKMAVNFLALALLECLLIPAFTIFSSVPLMDRPLALMLVASLSTLGFSALGVLVSASTARLSQKRSILALLLMPLMTPVFLGAAEATRLTVVGDLSDQWWRWIQLLTVFAALFTALGAIFFDFVLED